MDDSAPRTRWRVWQRPWMVETVVLFLVLWQESIRLELRTAHRTLPVPPAVERFYYYQFGDFANGYLNAFLLDGLASIGIARLAGPRAGQAPRWWYNARTRAWLATALSALSIVAVELRPSALTAADWQDIPAGVAGAVGYLAVRLFAMSRTTMAHRDVIPPTRRDPSTDT
jgi:hypothetical protein